MDDCDFETSYYRHVRTLDGQLVPIDTARRNGRLVPRFDETTLTPAIHDQDEDSQEMDELKAEVTYNLTPVERSTFLRFLDDWSIADVAKADRVSRAAIYERIHNMIGKNDYTLIWWRRKNKLNQHA